MNEKSRAAFMGRLSDALTSQRPSPGENPDAFVLGCLACLVEVAATTLFLLKADRLPEDLDTFEADLQARVVTPTMAAMEAAVDAWQRP